MQLAVGQTLVEHCQIIAEVEKRLHRITLRQCSSSHVIHLAPGQAVYLAPGYCQSPTEVYLLVVGKEPCVESAMLPVVGSTYEECGSRGPQYLYRRVVLSLVLLHRVEYSSAAEGIAVSVEHSSAGSGIFKTLVVMLGEQLRLACRHVGMPVHKSYHRCQPVAFHPDVRVEQHIVFRIHLSQCLVISLGKSIVLVED